MQSRHPPAQSYTLWWHGLTPLAEPQVSYFVRDQQQQGAKQRHPAPAGAWHRACSIQKAQTFFRKLHYGDISNGPIPCLLRQQTDVYSKVAGGNTRSSTHIQIQAEQSCSRAQPKQSLGCQHRSWAAGVHALTAGVTVSPTATCPGLTTAAFQPKNTSCVQDRRCSASPSSLPDLQQHITPPPCGRLASSAAEAGAGRECLLVSGLRRLTDCCSCRGSGRQPSSSKRGPHSPELAQSGEGLPALLCSLLVDGGDLAGMRRTTEDGSTREAGGRGPKPAGLDTRYVYVCTQHRLWQQPYAAVGLSGCTPG